VGKRWGAQWRVKGGTGEKVTKESPRKIHQHEGKSKQGGLEPSPGYTEIRLTKGGREVRRTQGFWHTRESPPQLKEGKKYEEPARGEEHRNKLNSLMAVR